MRRPKGKRQARPPGESSESVVFHLMQPARPDGRIGDEGWPAGLDETCRRRASGTRGMPRHASGASAYCRLAARRRFALLLFGFLFRRLRGDAAGLPCRNLLIRHEAAPRIPRMTRRGP
jgi:hypothetical protein